MDLARRLGLDADVVAAWESDTSTPDGESIPQLDYLSDQFSSFSSRITIQPAVEHFMRENNLDQVHIDDLES